MNLSNSIVRHVLATVALIFGSMVDVPKRFPDNGDDWRVSDVQLQVCSDDLNLAREPRLTITRYANKDMCCIHHNSPLKDGIIAMGCASGLIHAFGMKGHCSPSAFSSAGAARAGAPELPFSSEWRR